MIPVKPFNPCDTDFELNLVENYIQKLRNLREMPKRVSEDFHDLLREDKPSNSPLSWHEEIKNMKQTYNADFSMAIYPEESKEPEESKL